jgi:NitT/TauT family transport system ATP-binding protein
MSCTPSASSRALISIRADHISKRYGELRVLEDISLTLAGGNVYCLTGASGRGKTTLLRLILGLEPADDGEIHYFSSLSSGQDVSPRFSAVFQEDRLCETFSPLDNVLLTAKKCYSRSEVREELCRLLPEECLTRPVHTLSGGMKRRTAIARAMLAPADIILMDEPFTGLDEDTRHHVIRYILDRRDGRMLLLSTHQEEDIRLLGAEAIRL